MVSVCAPSFIPSFNSSNSSRRIPILPSQKTEWQRAVWNSNLPCPVKGFLLNLSVGWMDADGGSCFPSEEQMMARLGCSRPALTRWIRIAVEAGFLERWHYGRGIRNRRYNYRATFPSGIRTNLSDLPPEMGNNLSDHEPCPKDNHDQRESEPAPAADPALPACGAHSDFASQAPNPLPPRATVILLPSKTALPDDWQLPEDYRAWAEQHRPDLAGQMDSIASKFHDFHLSKATRSACWIAEWRRWINRERAVKPHQTASTATQPANRYAHLDVKEQPVSAAVKAALAISEQNRIAMLIQSGIDPTTGLPATSTNNATTTSNPPIPDQADQSYAARIERLMQRESARKVEREAGA